MNNEQLIKIVFFVKQKSAYEMRISDGSSDVCSSDLGGFGKGNLALRSTAILDRNNAWQRGLSRIEYDRTAALQRWIVGDQFAEIGRATCRERVCPYV